MAISDKRIAGIIQTGIKKRVKFEVAYEEDDKFAIYNLISENRPSLRDTFICHLMTLKKPLLYGRLIFLKL
jgi:hypothetical protein